MAAVLHHPEALLTGRAAAALHELDGFRPGAVEVVTMLTGSARSPLATVYRSMYFAVLGRSTIDRIPLVSVEEAFLSLVGLLSESDLLHALDTAFTQGRTTAESLADVHGRQAGDRTSGMGVFENLIADRLPNATAPSASEMDHLLDLLDHPDIPGAAGSVGRHQGWRQG
jgi:hypothetical protein